LAECRKAVLVERLFVSGVLKHPVLALNVCAGTARFPAAVGGIPEGICGTWFAPFNIKREVRGK
jgi:hypothetical protein